MRYQTEIHTLEIMAKLPFEEGDYAKKASWEKYVYAQNFDFVTNIRKQGDDYRLILNPHKLDKKNGKWNFQYGDLAKHKERMQEIMEKLGATGYVIRRLDVCLDADIPYKQNDKIVRFIALMLGEEMDAGNRYFSIDPLTGETKTLRLQNGDKRTKTLEVEHYNRELMTQEDWNNPPVENRFELRAMGAQAGATRTEETIIDNWIKRFQKIRSMERIAAMEDSLNEHLLRQWQESVCETGKDDARSFSRFVVEQRDKIFTREQLKRLYEASGKGKQESETAAKNLLRRQRRTMELCNYAMIIQEICIMEKALIAYRNGQK